MDGSILFETFQRLLRKLVQKLWMMTGGGGGGGG